MKKIILLMVMCMSLLLMAACGSSGGSEKAAPAESEKASSAESDNQSDIYRVIVNDEAGKPVQGAMVQFCSDQFCQMGETDADGIVSYPDTPEGSYHAKLYSVPEGFAMDSTEYPVPETYGDVTITLKAK